MSKKLFCDICSEETYEEEGDCDMFIKRTMYEFGKDKIYLLCYNCSKKIKKLLKEIKKGNTD